MELLSTKRAVSMSMAESFEGRSGLSDKRVEGEERERECLSKSELTRGTTKPATTKPPVSDRDLPAAFLMPKETAPSYAPTTTMS